MHISTSPWNRPLELAWEAWLDGSLPVGAVITDATGRIVAEGRNRVAATPMSGPGLHSTYIAHAEINALAALPPGEYRDHTIWSTLQPCFMCAGAVVHSHVGSVRFAAADPLVAGVERIPELNRWAAARWPRTQGPDTTDLGEFAGLLHLAWHQRRKPDGSVMTFHRTNDPGMAARAATALQVLADPPGDWRQAAALLGYDLS